MDIYTVLVYKELLLWILFKRVSTVYDAVEVAWKMLKVAKEQGIQLSNLQLQKLVYIAHGYMLGWRGVPLVKDPIEAWRYGPVISSIYHTFKEFGSDKIPTDNIDKLDSIMVEDEYAIKCIEGVLRLYGNDAPENLVAATHQPNTPWHEQWEGKRGKHRMFSAMDNDSIKRHYMKVINSPSDVKGL